MLWHTGCMLSALAQTGKIFYRAGYNLVHNDGFELAGYLTFLAILSLFPFLVILAGFAGLIGQGESGADFINLLIRTLPHDVMDSIRPRIDEIISGPPQGLLTISILGALWTSSSAMEGMRTVLNRAYHVSEPPTYLLRRLMSMGQVILFSAVIIIFMIGLVVSPLVVELMEHALNIDISLEARRFIETEFMYIGGVLVWLGVASLYYVLPNIKQSMLAVLPGAALCVALWILGAQGVTYYLAHVDSVNLIYGSLSGFIATLLFFYVMNIIFIYGAEFNSQLVSVLRIRIEEREHVEESPDDHVIKKH